MFNIQFKRIIQTGKYIPEIDGLRFIAIISVLFFHLYNFLNVKNLNSYKNPNSQAAIPSFIFNGNLGVQLFFAISGFILSSYFAKAYIHQQPFKIKDYFIRRLTRMEPPYMLIMILLFFASVYIAKTIDLHEALKSLVASLLYIHNICYGRSIPPKLNVVAWSLEVEVQFYLLAPIICLIFKIHKKALRRAILLIMAVILPQLNNWFPLSFISIYDYIQYFLIGMFIADLYLDKKRSHNQHWIIVTMLVLIIIYLFFKSDSLINSYSRYYYSAIIPVVINVSHILLLISLFYVVLFFNAIPLLKYNFITNIGGACYSIYLLHYPIISIFGNLLVKHQLTNYELIDNICYSIILLAVVLFISELYFLLIERPCMKKKWYLDLMPRLNKFLQFFK